MNDKASRAVREFAQVPNGHAEDGCHKIFQKYGFSIPIKIQHVDLGAGRLRHFPWLKFSSWAQYLLDSNRLPQQLCGAANFDAMKPILEEFWRRYRNLHPDHQVFKMDTFDASVTVPVYSHSDEGRSYKHAPIYILSTHGCIGRGTQSYIDKKKHRVPLKRRGLGLNFVGCTWGTQFMSFAILREVLDDHPDALNTLVHLYSQDMASLAREGLWSKDGKSRVFFLHLASKGDLPALTKLGSFKRTHSHVPRQPRSKRPCVGICHMCCAGMESPHDGRSLYPFEDVARQPSWGPTVNTIAPWDSLPSMIDNLPIVCGEEASFFVTDIWHNWHLGLSKHWIGSSLVSILERMDKLGCGSIDAAFDFLTDDFLNFCKQKKINPHMKELSRETMTWPMSKVCPVGRWSKGLVSTQLMIWLQDFSQRKITGHTDDTVLKTIEYRLQFIIFFKDYVLFLK